MPDLSETIEEAAEDPASAMVDGRSATARPLADLIAADRYLAEKATAGTGTQPAVRFFTTKPPGAV